MFFFAHPYHQQRRSHPTPYGAGPGHYGQHPFAARHPAPQFNFFNGGEYPAHHDHWTPAPAATAAHDANHAVSLDDEERAALAHLRSIQRRKEAERIIREEAERERAIAQLQARREAAIAAKVRAHQEREREIALARARIEQERELAIAHRLREIESARRAELESQRRRHQQRQIAMASAAARAQEEQLIERRRQCARHCAARRAEQERPVHQNESHDDGLEGLNRLLGTLFGIQLDTTGDDKPAEAPAAATETKKEETATAPAPAADAETKVPNSAPATTEPIATTESSDKSTTNAADEQKKAEFPDVINDVLANFLGLRVEPESKLGQAVSSKVPEGLNELLGQFGLEFVPDTSAPAPQSTEAGPSTTAARAAASAPQPSPATQSAEASRPRHPFDLSEFLNRNNGLPPFVRDILGNVEQAFKNEQQEKKETVEGKGKGVAEGEKKSESNPYAAASAQAPPAPAPAPLPVEEDQQSTTSTASIDKLESIASDVRLARDSFTFPSTLSFSHTAPTENVPSLLFNKQNKPYHAQNNKLLQLLLQADGVASNGDRDVRRKRKEVVKLVEAELEGLEKKRDEIWRSVKERRENGNESSDDESSSWTTGSSVDREEVTHVEDVAATSVEESHTVEPATTTEAAQPTADKQDAPATFAEAVQSAPEPSEQAIKADEASGDVLTQPEDQKVEGAKAEKEEGYELL